MAASSASEPERRAAVSADVPAARPFVSRADLAHDEGLVRSFTATLLAAALEKKIVLVFSETLGRKNGRPQRIFEAVQELKRKEVFARILQNVEIRICAPQAMRNRVEPHLADPRAAVFAFVDDDELGALGWLRDADNARLFSIDDTQVTASVPDERDPRRLPAGWSYPLLEVVTVALLDSQKIDPVEELPAGLLRTIGIEKVARSGRGLAFTLALPRPERYDLRQTVYDRYAHLTELLIHA